MHSIITPLKNAFRQVVKKLLKKVKNLNFTKCKKNHFLPKKPKKMQKSVNLHFFTLF